MIEHFFSDGRYAKQMFIPKGFEAGKHTHTFSHLSILGKGHVRVTVNGHTTEYVAPACVVIEANAEHVIFALEDSEWYCIHATNETDLEKIDQVLIGRK